VVSDGPSEALACYKRIGVNEGLQRVMCCISHLGVVVARGDQALSCGAYVFMFSGTNGGLPREIAAVGLVVSQLASTGVILIPMIIQSLSVNSDNKSVGVIAIVIIAGLYFQIVATLTITGQRYSPTNSFGTVAYRITNINGCTPFDSLAFLQKGMSTHVFSSIQLTEAILSTIAVFILTPLCWVISLTLGCCGGVIASISERIHPGVEDEGETGDRRNCPSSEEVRDSRNSPSGCE